MNRYVLTGLLVICFVGVTTAQNAILVPFKSGNHWGYADTTGVVKISADYDKVEFCMDGRCQVYKDSLTGFVGMDGSEIVGVRYEVCKPSQKHIAAKRSGKWGVIDWQGRVPVPFEFDDVVLLQNNFVEVARNGYWGMLKIVGNGAEMVAPIKFTNIEYKAYNKTILGTGANGLTIYNENGDLIEIKTDPEPDYVMFEVPMSEDELQRYSIITMSGKRLLIVAEEGHERNTYGKIVRDTIAVPYDSIVPLESKWNFIRVSSKNKWGIINDKGKVLLKPEYDEIDINNSRVGSDKPVHTFYAKKKGKWGVVQNTFTAEDKLVSSKVLIPFEYDMLSGYGRDYLLAQQGNLFGMISSVTHKKVTPVKYQKISTKWVYNYADFVLFMVKDGGRENVYVGENGVEFYE